MKLRFIVIDDIKGIRNIFCQYLTAFGHEVVCAEHPLAETVCNKALCTHEVACCDGYFVDLDMPHLSGIEFFESNFKRGCKVPPQNKILMSGNFSQEVCFMAKELGLTLVEKPIELSKIAEIVEQIQNRVDAKRS